MTKVLWISRHEMTIKQLDDLKSVVDDDVDISVWSDTVKDINELVPALATADVTAAVLPIGLMAELLAIAGTIPVIQSVSERHLTGKTIILPDGRIEREITFEHSYWQLISKIEIETYRL